MKNLTLSLFISLLLVGLYACSDNKDIKADGDIITQPFELGSFEAIEVSIPGNVYINQDGNERLEIETSENLFDVIEVEVKDGVLEISSEYNFKEVSVLNLYVQVDNISAIEMASPGVLYTLECLESPSLEVEMAGSGGINLCGNFEDLEVILSGSGTINLNNLVAESITTETTGSGEVNASGTSTSVDYVIVGSGDVNGFNMQADFAIVIIEGSGDVEANVAQNLDVIITGSGNVRYKGEPKVNSSITGSGTITKVN